MINKKQSKFAMILRAERENRNFTLDQMAEFLGTTKQVLSRYERGERSPKLITATLFAKRLGISVDLFTDEIDAPMQTPSSKTLNENGEEQERIRVISLMEKYADALEVLEALPDEKKNQALDYLRFLAKKE